MAWNGNTVYRILYHLVLHGTIILQELCSVPDMGAADTEQAVEAAHTAFQVTDTLGGMPRLGIECRIVADITFFGNKRQQMAT